MENTGGHVGGNNVTPDKHPSPETGSVSNGIENQLKTPSTNLPESSSLGLLLSDITSLILLSLSTEKFLQKASKQHPSEMYQPSSETRETFQLLEAAGSTIDVLYDLFEKETTVTGTPSDLENTLVKGASNKIIEGGGSGIEKSTSTNDLNDSLNSNSCHSGDYLSCESEMSRSLEMYRSCEQLIPGSRDCAQECWADFPSKGIFQSSAHDFKLFGNESSRSMSHLDPKSLLTVDSGIASPYQSVCLSRQSHDVSQAKDDSFLPKTSSEHKEHGVVGRVRKLKITVDQKLRDSLANLSNLYTDDVGTDSLREHVRKMQIRYEKATTDQWKTGSMYDVIMDKALATSVLAMENAQLGHEVNALRTELQMTYEQAKEKEHKGLFVSRFHETITQRTEKDDISDSEDSSSSDISTPDTQLLSSYAQRRSKRPYNTADLTTPIVTTHSPSAVSSGKRKLKVPPELKGPTYLSITTSSTSSSRSTTGSGYHDDSTHGSGCCGSLFCCFFRHGDKLDDSGNSTSSSC